MRRTPITEGPPSDRTTTRQPAKRATEDAQPTELTADDLARLEPGEFNDVARRYWNARMGDPS
ncbi:hypothetical protein [Pseudonocardia sp. 73-21]|uniref:hypothetical protein n=1 Tax=Pseudonocardia sp. 73-21 TaxID=1895809 RepID=UPI000964BE85|nr:hypothetical protein [Pseudonocardia sp. 73-21]OJY53537.1 MAG: hypothetical protein BGP03_17535 [Pseudonocardia sp. 73-21]